MELVKLIYDIKEEVSRQSDDRRLDDRYVLHLINVYRSTIIRNEQTQKPGKSLAGALQTLDVEVSGTKANLNGTPVLGCYVLRSTSELPRLIATGSLTSFMSVRAAAIGKTPIELIDFQRAPMLTFEFPVIYACIDKGYYLYFFCPNNDMGLKYASVTGVFEDPTEVDSTILDPGGDYPLPATMWDPVKNLVVGHILSQPPEDILNDDEHEIQQAPKRPRSASK